MTDKPLYELVDFLYKKATKSLPKSIKEDNSIPTAGVLGYVGARTLVSSIQFASQYFFGDQWIDETALPIAEEICRFVTIVAPVAYAIKNPEKVRKVTAKHPTYSFGMFSAWTGALEQVNGLL